MRVFEDWKKEKEERNAELKPGLFAEACQLEKVVYENQDKE